MSALLYCFDLFLTTPLITHNYQKVCENYECYKIIKAYLFSSLFHFLVLFFKGCHLTFQTTDAKKTSDLKIAREGKPHNVRDKNLSPVVVPLCVCVFSFLTEYILYLNHAMKLIPHFCKILGACSSHKSLGFPTGFLAPC